MPRGKKAQAAAAAASGNGSEAPADTKQELVPQSHDAQGQAYAPGMEPLGIPELIDKAREIIADKAEHARLTKKLKEVKPVIRELCKKYAEHFTADDNDPNTKWYRAAGVKIKFAHTEEEDVTVTEDSKTVTVANEY
jgi:hypothetical protein